MTKGEAAFYICTATARTGHFSERKRQTRRSEERRTKRRSLIPYSIELFINISGSYRLQFGTFRFRL
nr:MAG TPA: hypothetical protein [Caudoviricetes sp.]